MAATSFKITVPLLNNHSRACLDPLHELEIHPSILFGSVLSLLSQTHHLPYKSAFQLSLAAVSKLRRKPKKRASAAPPSLILAVSG